MWLIMPSRWPAFAMIADVLCYLLNLADVLKIDLSDAFYEKMKKNDEKYPADKYRGRFKL